MAGNSLFKINQFERNKFCEHIISMSSPKPDYYFLVVLSTIIVSLGLLADNVILVIGGMLVTPLLLPILAIALGLIINDYRVTWRSVRIFAASFAFAFVTALAVGFFSDINMADIGLITMMRPSLFTLIVAIVAGFAASFTWCKPDLNQTLPGIAVTVTLIPPLTAIGLAVAGGDWDILKNVISVFLLNVLGVLLASLLVFSLMEFYRSKRKLIEEVKEEQTEIMKIKKAKEKVKNESK